MFQCSICAESSQTICVYCTKDACQNHLCERCHRCSDCCACDMTVREDDAHMNQRHEFRDAQPAGPAVEEIFEAPVIADISDGAAEENMLGNVNGAPHSLDDE